MFRKLTLPPLRLALPAFLWGLAEASLFFVIPDVLISYVGLRRGLKAAALACLLAAVGAGIGGGAIYLWSAASPAAARAAVAAVPAVSDELIAGADAEMTRQGWFLAALKGPLSSTPYKVYAMLAPAHGAALPAFAIAALPVRLPRFLLVALIFSLIGRQLRGRVAPRILLAGFTAGWVMFYGLFWLTHPG